jgi:hypothetical protein
MIPTSNNSSKDSIFGMTNWQIVGLLQLLQSNSCSNVTFIFSNFDLECYSTKKYQKQGQYHSSTRPYQMVIDQSNLVMKMHQEMQWLRLPFVIFDCRKQVSILEHVFKKPSSYSS